MRLALIVSTICICPIPALADCTEQAEAAWRRTLAMPFEFELTAEEGGQKHAPLVGAFQWPSAMHYATVGPYGRHEEYYINGRNWMFGDGRWYGGKQGNTHGETNAPEYAVRFYAAFFGFRGAFLGFNGKGFEPVPISSVACAGEVERNGVKHVVYEYDVEAVAFGRAIDHDKIYVDAATGLVSRHEVVRRAESGADARQSRYVTDLRPAPSLVIKPPEAAMQ